MIVVCLLFVGCPLLDDCFCVVSWVLLFVSLLVPVMCVGCWCLVCGVALFVVCRSLSVVDRVLCVV